MKHYLIVLFSLFTLLTATSCASQRALQGDVQAVTAKLDANLKAFHMDESANGTVRLKRDKAIQIVLTKYGIEGARVIFTPDSILFINKLTKTYLRTSFAEADAMMGGEGTFNFQTVQSYLWNDTGRSTDYATLPVAGVMPLDLTTSYSRSVKVGNHRLPQRINVKLKSDDGVIEAGELKIKLTNVKPLNGWEPNTTVSGKYKNLNFISAVKKLIKK